MRVWVCTDHDGFWPVGTASVVLAETEEDARALLTEALEGHGLDSNEPFTLREIKGRQAVILRDGDY